MNKTISIHDFIKNSSIAHADPILKEQLVRFLKTDVLSLPEKSELISSTCDVIKWAILQARKEYVSDSQRLKGIISASTIPNALAVWGAEKNDWIVVSEGLMQLFQAGADDMAARLIVAFPDLMKSQLGQRIQAIAPLKGGFQTTLGSFLYFAAISYFVGHEAGHHLAGHDGYYACGAHAEIEDDVTTQEDQVRISQQALEMQADRVGIAICRKVIMQLLSQLWEVEEFTEQDMREYQKILTILLCSGSMMSVLFLKPKAIKWEEVRGKTHPPAVVRLIVLAMSLSESIKSSFKFLDESSRKWIRLKCLDVAVSATIKPGSTEDGILQERLARGGEPAAIRACGLRTAMYDPQLKKYLKKLNNRLEYLRPQLKPRTKA